MSSHRSGWVSTDALGPGVMLDEQGRVVPKLAENSALYVNEDGEIDIRTGIGLRTTQQSPNTLISTVPDVSSVVPDVTLNRALLAGKADIAHTHAEADVTGLVADLAGKAALVHTHTESDITDLTHPSGYEGFLHDGTIYDARRLANCVTTVALGNFGVMTANRTYAIPCVAPSEVETPVLKGLGVEITVAGGSGFIYLYAYTNSNGYPASQIVSAAKLSALVTGYVEDTAMAVNMTRGQLFWVHVNTDSAGPAATLRGVTTNAQSTALGRGAAGATTHQGGFYVDEVAGASDPWTQPPTAVMTGIVIPAIHCFWGT